MRELTPAELRVLEGVRDGLTDAQIAERVGVSIYTVRTQMQSVLRRLNVHTRTAAVVAALREGWIDLYDRR